MCRGEVHRDGAHVRMAWTGTRDQARVQGSLREGAGVLRDVAFDGDLRLGEDVDFVWRLHDRGLLVRYQPRARVAHTPRRAAGTNTAHPPPRRPAAIPAGWLRSAPPSDIC
ncbi:hypothetical protein ACWDSL_44715 [Streptomyces sp. NPDC000941]